MNDVLTSHERELVQAVMDGKTIELEYIDGWGDCTPRDVLSAVANGCADHYRVTK